MSNLKVRRAVIFFVLLTFTYVAVLFWVDRGKGLLSGVDKLSAALPVLMTVSFASYLVRYARWYWLLSRVGFKTQPLRGFIAYLAGFAFTATPGKVGELLRIRYFEPMGIPPALVLSVFVYERVFDLVVVLSIAALATAQAGVLLIAMVFVVLIVSVVSILIFFPQHLNRLVKLLERWHLQRLSQLARMFAQGLAQTSAWLKPLDIMVSFSAGVIAWGLTAGAFVWLLDHLGQNVPILWAFPMYPLAMLAGAASMLPGGLGSTEAVLIALLASTGIALATGTLAAIGIRVATLWFATLLGLVSVLVLELGVRTSFLRR